MAAHRKPRGFTLIEIFIALLIVALLLLLGMPSFTTYVRNSEIRSTAESLVNGLRTATSEAANRNKKVTFELPADGVTAWKFWAFEDDGVTKTTIQTAPQKETGKNSKVTISPAGQTTVTFNGLGRVDIDPASPNNHIRQIDVDSLVSGEARPLRIIVDDPNPADPAKPRGLRMCDPAPALAALVPPDPRAC